MELKNCFAGSAIEVSDVVNHNIMSIQLWCNDERIRIIIAYGPQENELKKEREQFYDDLIVEIERAKLNEKLILIAGDLNTKHGKDMICGDQHETSPNGAFLKKLIDRHELVVGNTLARPTIPRLDSVTYFRPGSCGGKISFKFSDNKSQLFYLNCS